ncbi:tRNA (5-methylaminomethyl-2-thiouridine)(34)-methyltransferase MnmD [Oceaniglobus indicus]|uniref:tRNA (5-methylaminomethyl-2-thiouridine)(34)-methyltransferase MnmD n=1 Tax=Oceaniglobus indicus TaxID=2047749 RepID=UPI001F4EB1A5|nr:tRNA (5-methylaminomethyl-2-thiouridine)(34)-methyltransferase MnmD [Oceaniglobus indicus]
MTDADQQPAVEWRANGVPVSRRFDDPYFSLDDGAAETAHVFLAGNDLPGRFCDGFHIAELGFGTGLNLLCSVQAWRAAGISGTLHFTTFEAFPLSRSDLATAHGLFPALADIVTDLAPIWSGGAGTHDLDGLRFTLIAGDARTTLPAWRGCADAWFLDGFAPARNPELWSPALMQAVADHTAPGGTAATYTAAGDVRRGLSAAGFDVTRTPGYGRKRHMTRAVLRKAAP